MFNFVKAEKTYVTKAPPSVRIWPSGLYLSDHFPEFIRDLPLGSIGNTVLRVGIGYDALNKALILTKSNDEHSFAFRLTSQTWKAAIPATLKGVMPRGVYVVVPELCTPTQLVFKMEENNG